jgi:hypothetical protein
MGRAGTLRVYRAATSPSPTSWAFVRFAASPPTQKRGGGDVSRITFGFMLAPPYDFTTVERLFRDFAADVMRVRGET